MGGRRALLLGVASTAVLAACGKSRTAPLHWFHDVDLAESEAKRRERPLFLFFFATWDCATKHLENETFAHPDVAALFSSAFVLVNIDCSDDEERDVRKQTARFHMVGVPTMVVMHAGVGRELMRVCQFMKPEELLPPLREAVARYHAIV